MVSFLRKLSLVAALAATVGLSACSSPPPQPKLSGLEQLPARLDVDPPRLPSMAACAKKTTDEDKTRCVTDYQIAVRHMYVTLATKYSTVRDMYKEAVRQGAAP